jgi:hypothetical protein
MRKRLVSASELARFALCERQYDLERRAGFKDMTPAQVRHLATQAARSADPDVQAQGRAAQAYVDRSVPAMAYGDEYHHRDAQRRLAPRPAARLVPLLILAVLALVFLVSMVLH